MTKTGSRIKRFERMYLCIGENFDYYRLGDCGKVMSLGEWLKKFFPSANYEDYFRGRSEQYILNYIHEMTGKRLTRHGERNVADRMVEDL